MTATGTAPPTGGTSRKPKRRQLAVITAAVVAAGGLGLGLELSRGGSSSVAGSSVAGSSVAGSQAGGYAYYQSVIGRYAAGSMMAASSDGWMAGRSGYAWMMGGAGAPGWMRGGSLPGVMMGGSTDPGKVMGRLFADAPGPRVASSEATRLGNAVPAGASVDRAANRLSVSTPSVQLAVVASPSMPNENFRIAGMVDPTVVVPAGAQVSIELVNADGDMAHGLVITRSGAGSSWMPMMSAAPAFAGAALWFLGESTVAGMHTGTLHFTASTPGTYHYLCPVPGHAQEGMVGTFTVSGAT